MVRQALAERLALPGPFHGLLKADPTQCFHARRHGHPLGVEVGHDHQETLIFRADKVAHRHPYVVEVQGGGIRRPPALLAIQLGSTETFRISGNQQHGDPPGPFTTGAHGGGDPVGAHTAGDKSLGAIDDIVIALAHRRGGQLCHIGAAAGFSDPQGDMLLAGQHRRRHFLFQGLAAPVDHRRQTDAVDHQTRRDAPHADARQFFIGNPAVPGVDALLDAAEFLRVTKPQQTHCRSLRPQFDRNMARLVPVFRVGHDLGIDEFAQLGAPLVVFGFQVRVGQAGAVKVQ